MTSPDISIVVCTYNRAAMLRNALESLTRLEHGQRFRYEIVVVDNASSDDTAAVVGSVRQSTDVPLRYVYEAKKGIAPARNRGLSESRGTWIASFDDDQIADPRWLLELLDYAERYNVRVVGGAVYLQLPEGHERDLHSFVRMLLGESRWSQEPFAYSPKVSPGAGNLMLHRSVLDRVGRFNEALTRAEDTDLFCRIWSAGIESWYVPAAIVHHVTPLERMQLSYLQRLSAGLGRQIAERERALRSPLAFLPRWLLKTIVSPTTALLGLALAKALGNSEAMLGLRCRLTLASTYAAAGGALVQSDLARFFAADKYLTCSVKPAVSRQS